MSTRAYRFYLMMGTESVPETSFFFKYSDAAGSPRRFHQEEEEEKIE
jgi:hypothetical protein